MNPNAHDRTFSQLQDLAVTIFNADEDLVATGDDGWTVEKWNKRFMDYGCYC